MSTSSCPRGHSSISVSSPQSARPGLCTSGFISTYFGYLLAICVSGYQSEKPKTGELLGSGNAQKFFHIN